METPGILSLIKITDDERELLLDYLHATKNTSQFDVLNNFFDKELLKFFDVFSGEVIKVPHRSSLLKIIKYIKIYDYCRKRNFTEESIETASRIFERRKNSIQRIINKVERELAKLEDGGDDDE